MTRIRTAALVTLLVAPILMAPGDPICPDCNWIQKWSDSLSADDYEYYSANVTSNHFYMAALYPNTSGLTVAPQNNYSNLDCSTSGNNTFCCYKALSTGTVTLRVSSGSEAASFDLFHLPCPE